MSGKIKRSAITKKVMKILYSEKGRTKVCLLNLTKEELTALNFDIREGGKGINANYNIRDEIDEVWLSASGKKYVESRQYFRRIWRWAKENYKWAITTAVSFFVGGKCSGE